APGVSTNPQAVGQCSLKEFEGHEVAPGVFTKPECVEGTGPGGTEIGVNKVVVFAGVDIPLEGKVYNLEPENGLASEFGVAVDLSPLGEPGLFVHTLIEGHVEWASDYHDYFEINVSPQLPLVSSRLVFKGNIGKGKAPFGSGGFLTNPTSCTGAGPQTTSTLRLKSATGEEAPPATYTTPIGTENCGIVPFAPTFSVAPGAGETASDRPDGITTELTLPHDLSPEGIDSSQLKTASITLPEGLTMNPSAAH